MSGTWIFGKLWRRHCFGIAVRNYQICDEKWIDVNNNNATDHIYLEWSGPHWKLDRFQAVWNCCIYLFRNWLGAKMLTPGPGRSWEEECCSFNNNNNINQGNSYSFPGNNLGMGGSWLDWWRWNWRWHWSGNKEKINNIRSNNNNNDNTTGSGLSICNMRSDTVRKKRKNNSRTQQKSIAFFHQTEDKSKSQQVPGARDTFDSVSQIN